MVFWISDWRDATTYAATGKEPSRSQTFCLTLGESRWRELLFKLIFLRADIAEMTNIDINKFPNVKVINLTLSCLVLTAKLLLTEMESNNWSQARHRLRTQTNPINNLNVIRIMWLYLDRDRLRQGHCNILPKYIRHFMFFRHICSWLYLGVQFISSEKHIKITGPLNTNLQKSAAVNTF